MNPPDLNTAKPLIIFDVDGTLVGGESNDWSAFGAAFASVTGCNFAPDLFDRITEVTAHAIIATALPADHDEPTRLNLIKEVARAYAELLATRIAEHPGAFGPAEGAIALLTKLNSRGYKCAIATGIGCPRFP